MSNAERWKDGRDGMEKQAKRERERGMRKTRRRHRSEGEKVGTEPTGNNQSECTWKPEVTGPNNVHYKTLNTCDNAYLRKNDWTIL
jgi:hypothetical protein